MAEKLKIIPLGGLNEIGKNMTVLEYGKDIIIVDCGLGFPDEEMYGVDLVIADMTYLVKNKDKIRGMFLTHGHEDHIGGIPYAMEQFNCPIHATRLTAGIVQLKLEEHQLQNSVHLFTHEAGEKVKAGCFTISSSLFGEEYKESIKGLSSQREIADDFFELLVRNFVLPCTLKEIAEDYVFKIYSLDC